VATGKSRELAGASCVTQHMYLEANSGNVDAGRRSHGLLVVVSGEAEEPEDSFVAWRRRSRRHCGVVGGLRLFLPEERYGEPTAAGKDRRERESWRLRHREQRQRKREHGELRIPAICYVAKTMRRVVFLAAFGSLAAMIVFGQQAAVAIGDRAEAGSCAIANAGSASGNTITCNFDMPPEKLKELIEAALKGGEEPILDRLEQVSETLGITKGAAKNLLKIVGEDSTIPDDKLAEALTKVAGDYKRLQAQVASLNPDNQTAKALVEQAKPEIDAGHFGRAHELLREATQVQIAAAQEAEKLEQQAHAARDAQMLGAASSTAADGDVAMTERRYTEAAELFGQAADYVPSGHASERGGYLLRQAGALYRQGDDRGDNAALGSAIEVYRRALTAYPRERAPVEWARAQNNLGIALWRLGEWRIGTERLEAVAAQRAALEELTRERAPVEWANTQNNLGGALESLGERESGTARLEEAVAAYRASLEVRTRERMPYYWGMTQSNLGTALQVLGERESGTARLEEAVAAYRASLEVRINDTAPPWYDGTQRDLMQSLVLLDKRKKLQDSPATAQMPK
jgi:tetratricopeptide (TPR) repeat protein